MKKLTLLVLAVLMATPTLAEDDAWKRRVEERLNRLESENAQLRQENKMLRRAVTSAAAEADGKMMAYESSKQVLRTDSGLFSVRLPEDPAHVSAKFRLLYLQHVTDEPDNSFSFFPTGTGDDFDINNNFDTPEDFAFEGIVSWALGNGTALSASYLYFDARRDQTDPAGPLGLDRAIGYLDVEVHSADFMIGKTIVAGDFRITPSFGATFLHATERDQTELADAGGVFVTFERMEEFVGAGPQVGLNVEWNVFDTLEIFGGFQTAVLFGQTTQWDSEDAPFDPFYEVATEEYNSVGFVMDIEAGVSWTHNFNDRWFIELEAGYRSYMATKILDDDDAEGVNLFGPFGGLKLGFAY